MQIGDRRICWVHFGEGLPVEHEGTVVYIHPERRFYAVQFELGQGRHFTECYYFPSRAGNAGAPALPEDREGNHSQMFNRLTTAKPEKKKRSFL